MRTLWVLTTLAFAILLALDGAFYRSIECWPRCGWDDTAAYWAFLVLTPLWLGLFTVASALSLVRAVKRRRHRWR